MKFTSALFFVILAVTSVAQNQLFIDAPLYRDKELTVLAFRGLEADTLFSGLPDQHGRAIIPAVSASFLLINLEDLSFPMIFSEKENIFRIDESGMPDFEPSSQNHFLLDHLIRQNKILSGIAILEESLKKFTEDTVISAYLIRKKSTLNQDLRKMGQLYPDSINSPAAMMLAAMDILIRSNEVKDSTGLQEMKSLFRSFIRKNYPQLASTDLLRQMTNRYMMMNELAVVGRTKMENQVRKDIEDWIVLLKDHYTSTDVVHYFADYFRSRLMISMVGFVLLSFPDDAPCTENHTGSGNILLPANKQESIFVLLDVDCSSSIAGQVLLHRFLTENKIEINAVTVFCNNQPDDADFRVLPDIRSSQFMKNGVASIGEKKIRIRQYPAFIYAGTAGKIQAIEYSFREILKILERKIKR